jgi:hypothetical protein
MRRWPNLPGPVWDHAEALKRTNAPAADLEAARAMVEGMAANYPDIRWALPPATK